MIASLKSQLVSKKELENGYAFQFDGSDKMIDELTEFIKTERACCDFFMFNLSVAGDKSTAWMELNEPAVNFYNKYNASYDKEWWNVRMDV